MIVAERSLPNDKKLVKSLSVGGVAGGEKFLTHNIFFKFVADFVGIYGGRLSRLSRLAWCSIHDRSLGIGVDD